MPSERCCGTSVGVLATDPQDRLLMIIRGWYPHGVAPVAGHVRDHHTTADDALVAEVAEEVGLEVTSHEMVWQGWLPNLCASPPAPIPGHQWSLGRATVTGGLTPAPVETRGAGWHTPTHLRDLTARTLAHARGEISDDAFARLPGLEPVWGELLHTAGLLQLSGEERELLRRLYTTPPQHYWLDGRLVPAEQVARDRVA